MNDKGGDEMNEIESSKRNKRFTKANSSIKCCVI